MATGVTHRTVEANGIRMHLAEEGEGPLVVLCHGFPESWYSWRHQLAALSAAGFHAVAPDMRGYGRTDRPEAIDQYTLLHLVGDMVGLLDALGAEQAVIAGHDWGAPVAWHAALLRPDRFRGVIGLSVPYRPRDVRGADISHAAARRRGVLSALLPDTGVAEAELERDPRETILKLLFSGSGDVPAPLGRQRRRVTPDTRTAMSAWCRGTAACSRAMVKPAAMPAWLGEADIDFYAGEFARTGFRGGLNWYRNIDRNWELLAPFAEAKVTVPALYVAGDRDLVVAFRGMDEMIANLTDFVPHLRATIMLPGCGHWTQQERPEEVNAAMIDFLRQL